MIETPADPIYPNTVTLFTLACPMPPMEVNMTMRKMAPKYERSAFEVVPSWKKSDPTMRPMIED